MSTNAAASRLPCVLCIGMAGSGKSTFVKVVLSFFLLKALSTHIIATGLSTPCVLNLDPAVDKLPYDADVDIRKSIDYKKVMSEYQLGPNGAILTSLNLFASKFDAALGSLVGLASEQTLTIVDTPGQIEVFTWSASGSILCDVISQAYSTAIAYIIDVPRCKSPSTFISNMLYATSIFYRLGVPIIVVLNKIDEADSGFILDWISDFRRFQEALEAERESYISSFSQSASLVLEEFYSNFPVVSVSSHTGEGMDRFLAAMRSLEARDRSSADRLDQHLGDLALDK